MNTVPCIVPHIRIEQHPNPDCRSYHVSRLVSNVHLYQFGVDNISSSFDRGNPGGIAKKLATMLKKLPGVSTGSFNSYEVSVMKGTAFDWNEISPFVVGYIVKYLFPECVGKTIDISTVSNYVVNDCTRHLDLATRAKTPVTFGARKRPHVSVEGLFSPQPVHAVVNGLKKIDAASPAVTDMKKSA